MGWNFDISQAPKGTTRMVERFIGKKTATIEEHVPVKIIAAGNAGVVTVSQWLAKEERWVMFSKSTPPLAWMLWPDHPHADGANE
jgi:hypothetical protein